MRRLALGLVTLLVSCSSFESSSSEPAEAGPSDAATPDGSAPPDGSPGPVEDAGDAAAEPSPPLAGPALWLDARRMTVGVATNVWPDGSGNAAHATGSVQVKAVTDGIKGHPAVQFLGVASQGMAVPAAKLQLDHVAGFTIFVVAKGVTNASLGSYQTLFQRETVSPRNGIWMNWFPPGSPLIEAVVESSAQDGGVIPDGTGITAQNVTFEDPHVFAMRVAGGILDFKVDGAGPAPVSAKAFAPFLQSNQVDFTVGGGNPYNDADHAFSGVIGSVTVYTRGISDAELATATAALKTDWAIP